MSSFYEDECGNCAGEVEVDIEAVLDTLSVQCEDCGSELSYGFNDNLLSLEICDACNETNREDSYDSGLMDGKEEGYENGYDCGWDEGRSELESENEYNKPSEDEEARFKDLGYEEGYADAQKEFYNA